MPPPVSNPPNPWLSEDVVYFEGDAPPATLSIYEDRTRSVITTNDSPDLPFDHGVNPYRGCYHGCSYCYARPSHEYLSFGSGTDFERKLLVKRDAPALLRAEFERPRWKGKLLLFSGITDCYQPLEASYRLTRQCLEVCAEYRNPVGIVTKGLLIERDLDVLVELHRVTHLSISISIPLWDIEASRAVEPYVAAPQRRMQTVARLANAGLDVGVNVSPLIPSLGDRDMPTILKAAADAGAVRANMGFLRLPGTVGEVFERRLRDQLPLKADRILARVRDARGGALNSPAFFERMRGRGTYVDSVRRLFETQVSRLGLNTVRRAQPDDPTPFCRPTATERLPFARGRAEQVTARGRAEQVTARGRAEQVTARGRAEQVTARGRAAQKNAREDGAREGAPGRREETEQLRLFEPS